MGITIASTPSPLLTGLGLFAAGLNNYRQQQSQFLQQQQLMNQQAGLQSIGNMGNNLAHQIGNYYQGQTSLANQKDLMQFGQDMQNQQAAGGMTADQEQAAANATIMGPPPPGVDQNAWNLSQYRTQRGLDQQAAQLSIHNAAANDALNQQLAIRSRAAMEAQYRMPLESQQALADQQFAQTYQQGPPGPGGSPVGPASTPNSRLIAWQQGQDIQAAQRAGQGQAAMDAAKARQNISDQISDVTDKMARLKMDPNAAANPATPGMMKALQSQLDMLQSNRIPDKQTTGQDVWDQGSFKTPDGAYGVVHSKNQEVTFSPLSKPGATRGPDGDIIPGSAGGYKSFASLSPSEKSRWVTAADRWRAQQIKEIESNPLHPLNDNNYEGLDAIKNEPTTDPAAYRAHQHANAENMYRTQMEKMGYLPAEYLAGSGGGAASPGNPPPQPPPQPLPPGGAASPPPQPPPNQGQYQVGRVYTNAKGQKAVWTGTGFKPVG